VVVRISEVGVLLIVGIEENLVVLSVKQLHGFASGSGASDFGVHEQDELSVSNELSGFLLSM
jgi:hypothetical protein